MSHLPSLTSLSLLLLFSLLLLLLSHLPPTSCQSFLADVNATVTIPLSAYNATRAYSFNIKVASFYQLPPLVILIVSSAPSISVSALLPNYTAALTTLTSPTTFDAPSVLVASEYVPSLPSFCPFFECDLNVTLTPSTPLPPALLYAVYTAQPLTLGASVTGEAALTSFVYFAFYLPSSSSFPVNISIVTSQPCSTSYSTSFNPTGGSDLLTAYAVGRPSRSTWLLLNSQQLYIIGVQNSAGASNYYTLYNVTVTPHSSHLTTSSTSAPLPVYSPTAYGGGQGQQSGVNASEAFVLSITVVVVICPLLLLCCMLLRAWRAKRRLIRESQATRLNAEAELRMRRRWRLAMEEARMEHPEEQRGGLSEEEIAALPVRVYRREEEEGRLGGRGAGAGPVGVDEEEDGEAERCSICLDSFLDGQRVKALRCGHSYHADCIDQWLRQGPSHCPLCLQRHDQAQNLVKRPARHVEEVELMMLRAAAQPAVVVVDGPPVALEPAAVAVPVEVSARGVSRTAVAAEIEEPAQAELETPRDPSVKRRNSLSAAVL